MQIAGIQKSSMSDYPGHVSIVVFAPNCNFDCFYCHNRQILNNAPLLDTEEVYAFAQKRANMIDAFVISGGEPTLQSDLMDFAKNIKELGFLVKLDTNGSNPKVIKELIDAKVLDFIAIDLKCSFDRYEEICRYSENSNVKESIEIAVESGVDYQIRTTMLPQVTSHEMIDTLATLPRIANYAVQQYKKPEVVYKEDIFRANAKPHTKEYLEEYASKCRDLCDNVTLKI